MKPLLTRDGRPLKAVLFDKDGTILDAFTLWRALSRERFAAMRELAGLSDATIHDCARALGYDIQTQTVDPDGPLALAPRAEEAIISASVLYRAGLQWDRAKELTERAYALAESRLVARVAELSRPLPGVAAALTELKRRRIKLAIVTTDGVERSTYMLRAAGLLEHFDTIVGRDRVERGKPHPDSILRACEDLGIVPGEAAMIGDTPADMETGLNAGVGLRAAVLTGSGTRERLAPLADVVLNTLDEILGGGGKDA